MKPAMFRGVQIIWDPDLSGDSAQHTTTNGEEMAKDLDWAIVERGPMRIQTVVNCPSHGDDCPHVAGECPSMQKVDHGYGTCLLEYVIDTEPIETTLIEYVEGVTGGRNVAFIVSDEDTPALLLGKAQ